MKYVVLGLTVLTSSLLTACTSTRSVVTKPLHPVFLAQQRNLSRYSTVTVQPFDVSNSQAANDQVGLKLATDIANRLNYDFGPLFRTVRVGEPQHTPDELVVSGQITDYRPGNRALRLLGPGISQAHLKGEVVLRDGVTEQPLEAAPIDKLWAWVKASVRPKDVEYDGGDFRVRSQYDRPCQRLGSRESGVNLSATLRQRRELRNP